MNNFLFKIAKRIRFFPQKYFVRLHYKFYTGKTLNLENPRRFNEKVQWLKIYYKPAILTKLVDKFEVRSFVAARGGEKYLNEMYDVYESADEIDFNALPDRFILKATHGYNMNYIVKSKSELHVENAREITSEWLTTNHYYHAGREWAYKNIKPRIIAEKFLDEIDKDHINDYKFYCFNGEPKFLKVDIDRGTRHAVCYYDTQWNKTPFVRDDNYPIGDAGKKPKNFDEMLNLAAKLSKGFPMVRVDLYNLNGKILFGELTFYPADGRLEFEPDSYNTEIGDFIKLPKIPKYQRAITEFPSYL